MWMHLNNSIDIKPNIFIDCRDLSKNKEIAPTYKLAKKYNINKGLIFAVDNLFFAILFLKDLDEFQTSSALIKTLDSVYYLSNKKIDDSYEIEDIVVSNTTPNIDKFDWISNDMVHIYTGRGLVNFNNGYIIVKG